MTSQVWTVPATVTRVTDGDTIRVRADLGWHVQLETAVRLNGVNAPELATVEGQAARGFLLALLPTGARVTVRSKRLLGSTEKYGRVLADVITADGVSVADALVEAGQAVREW